MEENIKILNMWNEKVKTLGKLKLKEAQELFIEMKKESNIKEKELKRKKLIEDTLYVPLNFINKNNKVTLIFSKKDYNDYDFIEVIIKNTKNKEEFTCPFTINSSNSITIDLSDIYLYFTDYEGSISIVAKCDNTFFSITPILSKENLTIINDFQKTNYKLFIRTLENGELRLSSIIKKL